MVIWLSQDSFLFLLFSFSCIVKLFDYLWILFTKENKWDHFRNHNLETIGCVIWTRNNDSDFVVHYHFCLESAGPNLNHLFHCQNPKDLYFSSHDPQIFHYGLVGKATVWVFHVLSEYANILAITILKRTFQNII